MLHGVIVLGRSSNNDGSITNEQHKQAAVAAVAAVATLEAETAVAASKMTAAANTT